MISTFFFFSVYLQVQGISLRDPRHVDSTTEVSHKGFARLFLLNFAKFSARCFCHSFSDKVWDFWSVVATLLKTRFLNKIELTCLTANEIYIVWNTFILLRTPMSMSISRFLKDPPKVFLFPHCYGSSHWEVLSNYILTDAKVLCTIKVI